MVITIYESIIDKGQIKTITVSSGEVVIWFPEGRCVLFSSMDFFELIEMNGYKKKTTVIV